MSQDRSAGLRIPPYLLTAGRTAPQVELALETLIRRTTSGSPEGAPATIRPELDAILACSAEPKPVIEVAGRTGLAVQVTRILIGDLVHAGLVEIHVGLSTDQHRDIQLLRRVLKGLRDA